MYPYRQLSIPPFGPGGGPPGPPPGQGPGFGPPGQEGPPPGPPPSSPPPQTTAGFGGQGGPSVLAVDPGAFYGCLRRYTWVRLNSGESFWFYPTFIGRRSVAGYRWFFFTWIYFGIDTNRISSFQCY